MTMIPLSLYIHLPWCVQKCPYCDFNSHALKTTLPEDLYVDALCDDLAQHEELLRNRPLKSIFFGGGTPSLFSGKAIATILNKTASIFSLPHDIEITLEANPGTVDEKRFVDFRAAGINRLSLGVQSLQSEKLTVLGRIHDASDAHRAIRAAKAAGFKKINIDIMYGLPAQTIEEALNDIKDALSHEPTHFSWYQLTIEPNTAFHHAPPILPIDDELFDMQCKGQELIHRLGLHQYEVSAYSHLGNECQHNVNYWEFGDYLGVGAGAHSKLTNSKTNTITRFMQVKHPKDYMLQMKRRDLQHKFIEGPDRIFEFMLNALRLTNGVQHSLFSERTLLPLMMLEPYLDKAVNRKLLTVTAGRFQPTALGARFLNDLMAIFL